MRLYGVHPVREALRARRRRLDRLHLRPGARGPELDDLRRLAAEAGVPILEEAAFAEDPEVNTQGVVLEAGPLPEHSLADLALRGDAPRMIVALDRVEDPQNVGAIARVAEAAGASGMVLTRRHAPPLTAAVARASAGAIEWLPTARVANLRNGLNLLKEKGFWVFGAEAGCGVSLFELPDHLLTGHRVVVLGAEGRGMRPGTAALVDHRVEIPMAGSVASLNVSAAAAVILFELGRRGGRAGAA